MNDLFSQLFNNLEPSKDEEEILTFSDYLDLLTREPWVARDSMQLLHDMLLSAGVEYNISPGKPLKHRYKFFEEQELIGPYVVFGQQRAKENLVEFTGASVESFTGLLVDYAQKVGASVVVRGLRAVSDFEHEFQMAQMNRHLDSKLETIFLMPNEKYFYTSSNLIKRVHLYGGRETDLVPPNVLKALNDLRKRRMTPEV